MDPVNVTQALVNELVSRNSAYQIAEDLPQLSGRLKVHSDDEFGFSLLVSDLPFEQLNYLLSLVIAEPFQSSKNDEGGRHNSYSCKLHKCFGHLTEKSLMHSEIVIHQDSDVSQQSVSSSANLAGHVDEVIGEVGQEISDLIKKLKAKNKANKELDAEFERLTKILDQNSENL